MCLPRPVLPRSVLPRSVSTVLQCATHPTLPACVPCLPRLPSANHRCCSCTCTGGRYPVLLCSMPGGRLQIASCRPAPCHCMPPTRGAGPCLGHDAVLCVLRTLQMHSSTPPAHLAAAAARSCCRMRPSNCSMQQLTVGSHARSTTGAPLSFMICTQPSLCPWYTFSRAQPTTTAETSHKAEPYSRTVILQ